MCIGLHLTPRTTPVLLVDCSLISDDGDGADVVDVVDVSDVL